MPHAEFRFSDMVPTLDAEDRLVRVPRGIATPEQLFSFLAEALSFPSDFGRTWDALDACMRDLSWVAEPCVAIVHDELPALPPHELARYIDALRDAELEDDPSPRELLIVFRVADERRVRDLLRAC